MSQWVPELPGRRECWGSSGLTFLPNPLSQPPPLTSTGRNALASSPLKGAPSKSFALGLEPQPFLGWVLALPSATDGCPGNLEWEQLFGAASGAPSQGDARGEQQAALTGSVSPTVTCSEKRTLAGLDLSFAFLAALMKADLGDWKESDR